VRLSILSRASDLARLQSMLVGRALEAAHPGVTVTYLTRSSAGDRDPNTPLAVMPDKGAFTTDLTNALVSGETDMVVHSWKDLPLEGRPDTVIAATLDRADPRDVLLMRRDVAAARPSTIRVLSSSPRRSWLLEPVLPQLLPWPVTRLDWTPVRGNIATRLTRLVEGRGDALVVAKAALDRLLGFGAPFEKAAAAVRASLDETRWMVLPIKEVPSAPAQGALAVEVAATAAAEVVSSVNAISHRPTWDAVMMERDILAAYGGGCHQAVGATVLTRDYGHIVSVRARSANGGRDERWSLETTTVRRPPRAHDADAIWPSPDPAERRTERRAAEIKEPADGRGFFVARAEALPQAWQMTDPARVVWTAGTTTWRKLAKRGVWVNGSSEGLGDDAPDVRWLNGRQIDWHRLTHSGVAEPEAMATYHVDEVLPSDLDRKTHFFWTSGVSARRAFERWPSIRAGWHGSGPGRTARTLRELMGDTDRVGIWLDYDQWRQEVLP